MQRFFMPPEALTVNTVTLTGEQVRQISRVLRMQPGDVVCLLDGLGCEYSVRLTNFAKDSITGEVIEKRKGNAEPHCKITLYLSLLNKVDKFEWALQKCTEIGAAHFVPTRAARSISDGPGTGKRDRWERIIQEAAEQSGRSLLPTIAETVTLSQAIAQEANQTQTNHIALMPAVGANRSLANTLTGSTPKDMTLSIFIGPEGGFTQDEVASAQQAGITPITLGPRIMRAETAAIAALTMALYQLGEMA